MSKPFSRYQAIVDDYPAFCDFLHAPLPTALWTNPERVEASELCDILRGADFSPEPVGWHPRAYLLPAEERAGKRWEFFCGLYQIQEEAAMLPVLLLDAQPGETVMDMCAAPGNKTAQLAFAMRNRGTIVANDLNRKRLPALRQTCERLGVRNVSITNLNAGNIPSNAARFDRILVDAPCSCEGTTRKNPGQPMESEVHFTERQRRAQVALLRKACQLCRVGGRIVYSTCTYAPEENEAVVNQVLQAYGPDSLRLMKPQVPGILNYSPGICQWDGENYDPSLRRCVRLWPHQNDTGGFFAAVLEKCGAVSAKNDDFAAENNYPAANGAAAPPYALNSILEQFAVNAKFINDLVPIRGRGNQLFLVASDHHLPAYFTNTDMGLRAVRTDSETPKPTHPGVLFLGANANKNVIQLSEDRILAFMGRTAIDLEPAELIECEGPGLVMVRCGKFACGLGRLCTASDGHHYLVSNYPRRWAARIF